MESGKYYAIEDLKRYSKLETSIECLKDKIASINAQLEGSGINFDKISVVGGHTTIEDKYINSISDKGHYERMLKVNILEYRAIKRAIESLPKEEQRILKIAFIDRGRYHIETIMSEFNVEKSRAYELKKQALDAYIVSMYGG